MTLILFVISLTAFVAYRGGYVSLTQSAYQSNNEEVKQDSIPVKFDSLTNSTWMYSSKSIILTKPFKKSDSSRKLQNSKRILMSGSKSGAVFVLDTARFDSIKLKPIRKRK
ncbi:MAG: hypothetical protein HYZ44_14145 [Bacteroidetes bacterium]|nr:hypothetical protein [Bacteroidota bacterium]